MKSPSSVAVTSRSFSRHPQLRAELEKRYQNVTFNDVGASLKGEELARFLAGHERAIVALERIDAKLLARLPDLKVLSKFGVGLDSIDLQALDRRGVLLAWTGGTNRRSVAELVLGLSISLLRHLVAANAELRSGTWRQPKGGCLSGRTVGIVGCGNIGRDLIELLRPFGCPVLVYDVRPVALADGAARQVDLPALLRESDVVTLHLPAPQDGRPVLDRERLALMKPTALLINTARGGLVDEAELKEALKSGRLAGAGFDVFAVEPPVDRELLALPNFLATPHVGGSTEEAILAMGRAAIDGLERPRPAREFLPAAG